jgi:phage FluMu protein gp41
MDEQFYVDEFFASEEDAGRVVMVTVRGREVPITVRARGITNEDRMAAQLAATEVITKNNRAVSTRTDPGKAGMELAARMVLDWPFVDRATGEKLPITAANLARMFAGADQIIAAAGEQEAQREETAAPFAAPSEQG